MLRSFCPVAETMIKALKLNRTTQDWRSTARERLRG
jgi:hypothetical protein